MSYASLAQLKNYLGIGTETATDDVLLNTLIQRGTKAIDTYCSRRFEASTATRYYESNAVHGTVLYLDEDLISITTLTNGDSDATVIPNTEYWLWPRNDGPPYWAIRLKADSDYYWEVDTDYMISVLGSWGWSATPPEDVVQACIRYAAYLYHQKDSGVYDVTTFPEAGVITTPQGIPRDVRLLLDPYKRRAG